MRGVAEEGTKENSSGKTAAERGQTKCPQGSYFFSLHGESYIKSLGLGQ